MTTEVPDLRRAVRRELVENHRSTDEATIRKIVHTIDPLVDPVTSASTVAAVTDDIRGLGPLQRYLDDEAVSDVLVVGGRGTWIERDGALVETDLQLSEQELSLIVERIVAPLGKHVDRSSPTVDARLPDGTRVHVAVPPIAVDGTLLSIRRFKVKAVPLSSFCTPDVEAVLVDAVGKRRNLLVVGGTGAGKTTLLNSLASHIAPSDRIVTVEDTAELRLPLRHVARMEARVANSEGIGEVTIRDLVKNALRMRPDRVIVGEVRAAEALDMLQAMNTGHSGCMATCHANGVVAAIRRLETLVLFANSGLPLTAVRQQIMSAIDMIVYVERVGTSRRITQYAVITGEGNVQLTNCEVGA